MSIWFLLGMVFLAGAVGGMINSLINDKGLLLPRKIERGDGTYIFLPGFVGTMLTGGVAASVSWLLYGPLGQAPIGAASATVSMALATLGGAALIGIVGAAWLTNAVDKHVFQAAASQAAAASPSPETAKQMLISSPVDALNMAKQMGSGTPALQESGVPIAT
jgi:hypothetical protein